ncbi:hypothetical protein NOF04DRAFT_1250 [Fusarium oxysporum II5]|uniref:Uncharacterized protein n=1 Tax=Fusarium odoratissimum (strain NRRL 54006) TaxID=1089451 RepID=X0KQ70_FUSO5|nr:uncharacterized protein FOIG_00796 [Fusarium odoratissimum NRRL 54006]EXM10897.1 hypothetical protein FOIG_00796 [Fusarium odoratissimum NRRL 54006]KAK2137154.1 hypothetical protein NOF04DRAFT_1250 [Fusarium oxysporum II5]
MSGQEERHGTKAILCSKSWSEEDALRALDAEFWCRNKAHDPENFVPGVSTILVGDPGYEFWLELRAKIQLYFQAALASPGSQGNWHPMTRKTIKTALLAVRASYDDQYVDVDGERVPWKLALPDRADWIVDRDDASIRGDDEDDASIKNDDDLSSLKTEIENQQGQIGQQRDEFNQLQSKVEHLEEEGRTQQTGLEGLEGDYRRLKEKSDEQAKEMEQLRSTIVGLTKKVDKLQAHIDGQEELHKKHMDEVLKLSSMFTASMEEIKSLKSSNLHQPPAGESSCHDK